MSDQGFQPDVGTAAWLDALQEEQIAWAQQPDDEEPTELPWWHGEYSSDPNEAEDDDEGCGWP